MLKVILLSMATMFLVSSIFASADWPNEPAGSTPRLDCPMDNVNCDGKLWAWAPGVIKQPAGAPFSAPNALANVLPKDSSHIETGTTWLGADHIMDDIYVGFWWKMNKDFEGLFGNGQKLVFVRSANKTFGTSGINGVFGLDGQRDQLPWTLVFSPNTGGIDNSHTCSLPGGGQCRTNVYTKPSIYRDVWYKVELYVKASSCNTCRNGIVRWWVNDTLLGDYRDMNYGSGNVNEFTIQHTWDGVGAKACYDPVTNPNGRDCTREWIHYFDHIRISEPNCGAAGCAIDPYVIIDGPLASARVGTAYKDTLYARGAQTPYTYTLISGTLPGGISMSSSGIFSGTPTCGGKSTFTVQASDANGVNGTESFSITGSGTPICATGIQESGEKVSSQQFTVDSRNGKVRFTLPGAGHYQLSVYDFAGSLVWKDAGKTSPQLIAQSSQLFNQGVYVAKLVMAGKQTAQRFTVIR